MSPKNIWNSEFVNIEGPHEDGFEGTSRSQTWWETPKRGPDLWIPALSPATCDMSACVKELCRTIGWDMFTCINQSCPRVWMSHIHMYQYVVSTCIKKSCSQVSLIRVHMYQSLMSHTWMSHFHTSISRVHMHSCVISTHIDESCPHVSITRVQ